MDSMNAVELTVKKQSCSFMSDFGKILSMTTAAERRRRIRVPLQQTIRHSKYQVLGTPVFEETSSIDLSSGGISFETAQDYKKGTLVLLEVEIENEVVMLLVCVAWIKPHMGRFMIGAELIAIDPEHKKTMQGHLNRLIREVSKASKKIAKKKPSKKKAQKKKR
jgi:Tfp pilus assembly protein PilZ